MESEKQQKKYEAEKFYLKSTACKCMQIFENVIFLVTIQCRLRIQNKLLQQQQKYFFVMTSFRKNLHFLYRHQYKINPVDFKSFDMSIMS